MVGLNIRVQSLADAAKGMSVIENQEKKQLIEVQDITICIQEAGTVSGQTTLMILLDKGTQVYYGQITKNHFDTLKKVVQAAEERFAEEAKNRR